MSISLKSKIRHKPFNNSAATAFNSEAVSPGTCSAKY